MATLKNHPDFWLRDDAAAAFDAYEAKYGKRTVNSAGRYEWEQQRLINRWDKGGVYNRPPYLYRPARPASASNHVKGGGIAVDIYDWREFKKHCQEFGYHWWGESDPVHFEFRGWNGNTPSKPVQDAGGKQTPPAGEYSPFGIKLSAGLQKIAKLYGYTGRIDQKFGAGSMKGFATFLRRNWGYVGNDVLGPVMWAAIARWLRARWGYVGNDVPGPVMRAALQKAETANYREL